MFPPYPVIRGRNVPHKPCPVGGVKSHNMNEISFPGSLALGAGSFTRKSISLINSRFYIRRKEV